MSGSYHLGNGYRAYNPTLMRFNCPDNLSPFGHGGINPYAYCVGDPINRADPSGHISWQAGLGIGLGILGIIATAGAAAIAISAAGGIAAALGAASTTSLLTAGVGVGADILGIASGADSDPELSATLGWVSMGAGLVGGDNVHLISCYGGGAGVTHGQRLADIIGRPVTAYGNGQAIRSKSAEVILGNANKLPYLRNGPGRVKEEAKITTYYPRGR